MDRARRRAKSKYPESHPDASLDPYMEQASLYSAPSLYSMVSNFGDIDGARRTENEVIMI